MRIRRALALSVVSAGLGAGLVACFDLFHSTSSLVDACQVDADACNDAAPVVDFCAWEAGTPRAAAAIACTWLSTCEQTSQYDDFGECMVRALLAYDCNANPNNPVTGPTKQQWIDLLQATGCQDVDRIVFGGSAPTCPEAGLGCFNASRVYCGGGAVPASGENCALWNQTCSNGGCTGCLGCFAGTDAGACTPDASATCSGTIASSCPDGTLEAIDCQELLQQPGTCNAGPLAALDPTSPCYLDAGISDASDAADAGPASMCSETCTGNTVTTCTRGVAISFDCSSIDAGCQPDGAFPSCAFSQ